MRAAALASLAILPAGTDRALQPGLATSARRIAAGATVPQLTTKRRRGGRAGHGAGEIRHGF